MYYINNNTMNIIDTVRGHRKMYLIVARFVKYSSLCLTNVLGIKICGQ